MLISHHRWDLCNRKGRYKKFCVEKWKLAASSVSDKLNFRAKIPKLFRNGPVALETVVDSALLRSIFRPSKPHPLYSTLYLTNAPHRTKRTLCSDSSIISVHGRQAPEEHRREGLTCLRSGPSLRLSSGASGFPSTVNFRLMPRS